MSEFWYSINLDALCETRDFNPEQVESARLVFPRGAVPNPMLLWVRVRLRGGETKFITLPLKDFYRFVDLPEDNLRVGGVADDV